MRRVAALLGTAAVILLTAGVYAQGKANFSGKWTVDAEKTQAANPAPAGGGGGGGGRGGAGGGGGRGGAGGGDLTITQDATNFTVESAGMGGNMTKAVYKLNGEGKNMGGRDGSTEIPYKCKVAGDTISIETTNQGQNGPTVTTAVYSMEGAWMVRATTRPGRDGSPQTTKTYYKKG